MIKTRTDAARFMLEHSTKPASFTEVAVYLEFYRAQSSEDQMWLDNHDCVPGWVSTNRENLDAARVLLGWD